VSVMCDGCKSVHEDLTEPIDSSMCVRFTLARVNWRIGRTTEMMLMLVTKIYPFYLVFTSWCDL